MAEDRLRRQDSSNLHEEKKKSTKEGSSEDLLYGAEKSTSPRDISTKTGIETILQ